MRSDRSVQAASTQLLKDEGLLRAALIGSLIGACVGLGELLLLIARRYWLGHILYLGPHAVWMTPAANLILFAVIGSGASSAAFLAPPQRRIRFSAVVLASAASLALLLHVVWLALWAAIVISGRMIAYNWFDCDRQPQPAFINWAASCPPDISSE